MPINCNFDKYEILAAGATKSFDVSDKVGIYRIYTTGTVILLADMIFNSSGTPVEGTKFEFRYEGAVNATSFDVIFFGISLTLKQAIYKQVITCYYTGSTWKVHVCSDDTAATVDIDGGDIVLGSIPATALAGDIPLSSLVSSLARGYSIRAGQSGVIQSFNAVTAGSFLMGNGTDVVSQALSGDMTVDGSGVATLTANSLVTTNITDANVTVAKLEAALKTDCKVIPCSFQTGEVGAIKFKMPFSGSITDIYAIATTAIASTDAGTIVLKNNAATTMTVTTPISFTASDAYGTSYTSAVTANNTFVAGDLITILTAKATAGGRALVTLTFIRS